MITVMQKQPGAQYFVMTGLEDFFSAFNATYQGTCVYIVRSQKEKEVLDGYCLIYGRSLRIEVGGTQTFSIK